MALHAVSIFHHYYTFFRSQTAMRWACILTEMMILLRQWNSTEMETLNQTKSFNPACSANTVTRLRLDLDLVPPSGTQTIQAYSLRHQAVQDNQVNKATGNLKVSG